MWHLLPKKLDKRDYFILRLAGLVAAMHFLVIFQTIRYSSRAPLSVRVGMQSVLDADVAVRILPFVRRTGNLARLRAASRGGGYGVESGQSGMRAKVVKLNKSVPSAVHAKPHKKHIKKFSKDALKPAKKTGLNNKKEVKKEKAVLPKASPRVESSVIEQSAKHEAVTNEGRGAAIAQGLVLADVPLLDQLPGSQLSLGTAGDSVDVSEGPITIGMQEFEELSSYQEVQEELAQSWHPPLGLRVKNSCIVLVTINDQGRVEQLDLEQSSGALAYDQAARMAVRRTTFPKSVWHRQIRLHF